MEEPSRSINNNHSGEIMSPMVAALRRTRCSPVMVMAMFLYDAHIFRCTRTRVKWHKRSFLFAIRVATSTAILPQFEDDIKTSAQEQVEFMLEDDEKIPLVIADDEIKVETRIVVSNLFCYFENELFSLILEPDIANKEMETKIMRSLSDLEWMHNTLLKMDLMKDFVSHWANISSNLMEVLPAESRVELLKTWLPYIRKMKSLSDKMGKMEAAFPYKMSEDLCQCIEGAIVSLTLVRLFEIWCYRTKSAQRRLMRLDRVSSAIVTLYLISEVETSPIKHLWLLMVLVAACPIYSLIGTCIHRVISVILSTGDLEVDANFEYITISADDEEKQGYKGLNISKTLRPRAEFKIYV
ncbi:hypothetical protein HAX54_000433 [Datura stramonium]|uniref:Uncharacterized protein n=1 Tax=Datura stramonium TaxID=4076 RepID=A0ABS8T267_DATST|nr:hypothetical protein [Datura stramonium]